MRKRLLLVTAALSILLIGCGTNQVTPTLTLPPTTPTHIALPSPTSPEGWSIHHKSNIQVALPTSLHEIELDESALKSAIEAAQSNNPPLAETLRGILESGQYKSLLFYAVDTAATIIGTNVTVVQTTIPNGTRPQDAEQHYVDALPELIKG